MQQRNRAAYMISPKKIELRELPMPTAKPGEVILKVEGTLASAALMCTFLRLALERESRFHFRSFWDTSVLAR